MKSKALIQALRAMRHLEQSAEEFRALAVAGQVVPIGVFMRLGSARIDALKARKLAKAEGGQS